MKKLFVITLYADGESYSGETTVAMVTEDEEKANDYFAELIDLYLEFDPDEDEAGEFEDNDYGLTREVNITDYDADNHVILTLHRIEDDKKYL